MYSKSFFSAFLLLQSVCVWSTVFENLRGYLFTPHLTQALQRWKIDGALFNEDESSLYLVSTGTINSLKVKFDSNDGEFSSFPLSSKWNESPDSVDDIVYEPQNKTFMIFKGNLYWMFAKNTLLNGFPKVIEHEFPGVLNPIDAVELISDYIFFFKDKKVLQFDTKTSSLLSTFDLDVVCPLLSSGINAAFVANNNLFVIKHNAAFGIPLTWNQSQFVGFSSDCRPLFRSLQRHKRATEGGYSFFTWLLICGVVVGVYVGSYFLYAHGYFKPTQSD